MVERKDLSMFLCPLEGREEGILGGIIRTCSKEGSFSDFSESDVKWETLELWALYFIAPIQSFSNDNYFLPRSKT